MLFLQGLGIGIAIAAPVGVIGILCIQRTLNQGRWVGFVSGMGAATADGLYGSIAGLSLSTIADTLMTQSHWLMLLGGLFLCGLGVTTFRQTPPRPDAARNTEPKLPLAKAYISVLLLTLTNPLTIFSFLGVFSGLGLGQTNGGPMEAIALVSGVFLGSALWWLTLSSGVYYLSHYFKPGWLLWLNRASGIGIAAFGVVALQQFIQQLSVSSNA